MNLNLKNMMMISFFAAVAVVSVDNVERYPSIVVNLEDYPQCGTVQQPIS